MESIRKRLTYANVMSSIAVFLVVGGGAAFAATNLPARSVGSRQLQPNAVKTGFLARNAVRTGKIAFEAVRAGKLSKNAVPTNRLRNNAVTGAKIRNGTIGTDEIANDAVTGDKVKESSLGTVPSADNANTVGGTSVKRFFYASGSTTAVQTILTLGGLTLTASCPGGVPTVNATTAVDNAMIHSGGTWLSGTEVFYVEDDSFDIGNNFDFVDKATTEGDSVQGTLTYVQPNGTTVTAIFASEQNALGTQCVVSGHATG